MAGKETQLKRTLIFMLWCLLMISGSAYGSESDNPSLIGPGSGCGIAQIGNGEFVQMKIHVLDRDRFYYLRLPNGYNRKHAYPLVFRWHGFGGDGLSGGLDIEFAAGDDAIIVAANGLDKNWDSNTDSDELLFDKEYEYLKFNTDPVDILFFDRMLDTVSRQYCINRDRIFSYGYSSGGYFTNLLACERGDVLRASAAVSGGLRGGGCKGKVASWFLHDSDDQVIPIVEGKAARDRAIATNGCMTNTKDVGDGCIRYLGCEDAPVVWCESKGIGHKIRGDFAPMRVWRFFQSLH